MTVAKYSYQVAYKTLLPESSGRVKCYRRTKPAKFYESFGGLRVHSNLLFPEMNVLFPNFEEPENFVVNVEKLNSYLACEYVLHPTMLENLRGVMKSLTMLSSHSIISHVLKIIPENQVCYQMWESFLSDGDWYATTVVAIQHVPEEILSRYVFSKIPGSYSEKEFLRELSAHRPEGDLFALPVDMLKGFISRGATDY